MSNGLIKLAQEDPSFNFSRDEETNQTVIEGMGELHLDIIVDRLRREFKVRCRRLHCCHPPSHARQCGEAGSGGARSQSRHSHCRWTVMWERPR